MQRFYRFIDVMFLFLIGCCCLTFQSDIYKEVIYILVAFSSIGFGLGASYRWIDYGFIFFGTILCIVHPLFLVFYPIYCYLSFLSVPNKYGRVIGIPGFLLGFYLPVKIQLIYYLGLLLSFYLYEKTSALLIVKEQLIQTRDYGIELNMALKEKNKSLMEKQDYEVYSATLTERNRIAREIHDNVGHLLSRVILQVGALKAVYQKEESLNASFEMVLQSLTEAMNRIRNSVHDLHDEALDLDQSIRDIVKDMTDYEVRYQYDMSKAVDRKVKYCFVAIVKESINNIIKHSNATNIEVILREHPAFYQLFIKDNGSINKNEVEPGIGLMNMKERVSNLKGNIEIRREDGFQISIFIPKQGQGGER